MDDSESRRQAELLRLHNEMMRARQAELLRQSKVTTKLEEKIRQSALLQVRAGQTGQTTHKATNEPSRAELIASLRTFIGD